MNKKINISKQKGFTFMEIMVVIVIIAILAVMIVPNILKRVDQARVAKAENDIRTLDTALDMYKLDNGFYPTTEQGLGALTVKPNTPPVPGNWSEAYVKQLPKDPCGNFYQYAMPGKHGNGSYDVWSKGPPGENKDIGNWNLEQ